MRDADAMRDGEKRRRTPDVTRILPDYGALFLSQNLLVNVCSC